MYTLKTTFDRTWLRVSFAKSLYNIPMHVRHSDKWLFGNAGCTKRWRYSLIDLELMYFELTHFSQNFSRTISIQMSVNYLESDPNIWGTKRLTCSCMSWHFLSINESNFFMHNYSHVSFYIYYFIYTISFIV